MSDDETIQLVDMHGNPLEHQFAPAASREQLTLKVYNYFIHQPEALEFISSVVADTDADKTIVNGKMHVRLDDSKFQASCLNYGSEAVINAALDENLPQAYAMLLQFADLPLYQNQIMTEITVNELCELEHRFVYTPELGLAKKVCDVQAEITGFLSGNLLKNITSFQANRIQEKFEDITQYLNFEQRAAGYYNISIIHRALLGEKDTNNTKQNNAEKDCLKKVLEYTSDYKRINYCINRLGSDFADQGVIRAAYRRALQATGVPNDLYKINIALAQCYLDDFRPKIGFAFALKSPSQKEEYEKLEKAEMYYQNALRYAQKPEKLSLLKNIAKLQLKQRKIREWTETETTIAMKFLQGEERCNVLIDIAAKNQELAQPYMERALEETIRSRKISKPHKKILLTKINYHLRTLYTKQGNQQKLQELDAVMNKYAPQTEQMENPLLKYTKQSRQKQ